MPSHRKTSRGNHASSVVLLGGVGNARITVALSNANLMKGIKIEKVLWTYTEVGLLGWV